MGNKIIVPLLIALFTACDQIKEPIPPGPVGGGGGPRITNWDLDNSYLVAYVYNTNTDEVFQVAEKKIIGQGGNGSSGDRRRVLLEDFTGHRCNNCPAAANTAQQLIDQYPDDVVVVGVHVTEQFAAPLTNSPSGGYMTDFRTTAGLAYEQAFNVTWLPAGMVNRKEFDASHLLAHASWPARVSQMVGLTTPFDVFFSRLEFDPETNLLAVEVKVAILENMEGSHNLIIYLTEDHVIDWQYDSQSSPPDVQYYEHRHVLRANINGTWGGSLTSGTAMAGDTITLAYTNFPL